MKKQTLQERLFELTEHKSRTKNSESTRDIGEEMNIFVRLPIVYVPALCIFLFGYMKQGIRQRLTRWSTTRTQYSRGVRSPPSSCCPLHSIFYLYIPCKLCSEQYIYPCRLCSLYNRSLKYKNVPYLCIVRYIALHNKIVDSPNQYQPVRL